MIVKTDYVIHRKIKCPNIFVLAVYIQMFYIRKRHGYKGFKIYACVRISVNHKFDFFFKKPLKYLNAHFGLVLNLYDF